MTFSARIPLLFPAVFFVGCATSSLSERGSEAARSSMELGADVGAQAPGRPPAWRSVSDRVESESERPSGAIAGADDPVPGLGVGNPLLRARCADSGSAGGDDALLRGLIAEHYRNRGDPGTAVEALIIAGCGAPDAVVRELVAQGGDRSVLPVIDRAVALQGPTSAAAMERAAAEGLARWRSPRRFQAETLPSPLVGSNPSYGLIYFPLARHGESGKRSSGQAQGPATVAPGFGIYTFILRGEAVENQRSDAAAGLDSYRELLRVIETYVIAAEGAPDASAGGPKRQLHGFLLPVPAGHGRSSSTVRYGPALSERMRGDFADYLRAGGQVELAQRLTRAAGPFLVSSLEPRLVPVDPSASRLLVDLTEIGPEYMYSIVDAYDHPIPAGQVGRIEGLNGIRTRLFDLFPDTTVGSADAAPGAGWVYLFGRRQDVRAVPRATGSPMLASVAVAEAGDRDANSAVIH